MGSKHVMLDFMIRGMKNLYLIPSLRVEPWTRTAKVFEKFFLEKVTGKILAKRTEEGKNLK